MTTIIVLTRSQIFIQKKISKIYTQDFKNSQKNVLFEYICAYRYLKKSKFILVCIDIMS